MRETRVSAIQRRSAAMGSFKLRLVLYFVLLSLVPLVAATWAFSETVAQSELQRADMSLNKSARAAAAAAASELDRAELRAAAIASDPDVQAALARSDRAALDALADTEPNVAFFSGTRLLAGRVPSAAASSSANVATSGSVVGRVVVFVPYDAAFLARVEARSALGGDEQLALVVGGRVTHGAVELVGAIAAPPLDEPGDLTIADTTFRAAAVELHSNGPAVQVVALIPRAALEGALTDLNLRLLLAALGSIAIVAAVAFLSGRTIVASLRELARGAMAIAHGHLGERVPIRGRDELARVGIAFNEMAEQLEARQRELLEERQRVHRAAERLGAALAAGNEPERLLEVIATSALEMTEAAGVTIVQEGEILARAGTPETGGDPITLDLGRSDEGRHRLLLLFPVAGRRFDEATIDEAISLAAQAAVALENARLHHVLARQAVTDELTQLANRRRFDEELAHEVNRVLRFGGPLSLVVADLDDFKQINDTYGHQVGDKALRAFAETLRRGIRAVDIAARRGGEEFAVILPGTALPEARAVAERLRRAFASVRIPVPGSEPLALTASFGAAEYLPGSAPADLFSAADAALYEAKALGKNRVRTSEECSAARRR